MGFRYIINLKKHVIITENMKRLLIIAFIFCTACAIESDKESGIKNPVFCTEEQRFGLEITIKYSTDDTTIPINAEKIVVLAKDGDYTENLINKANTNVFTGAIERPGNYVITISGEGFRKYTSPEPIAVESDQCHVITKSIEIQLKHN